jgi:hypothetical protein
MKKKRPVFGMRTKRFLSFHRVNVLSDTKHNLKMRKACLNRIALIHLSIRPRQSSIASPSRSTPRTAASLRPVSARTRSLRAFSTVSLFLTLDRATQSEEKLKLVVKTLPISNVSRMALNVEDTVFALARDNNFVLVLNLKLCRLPISLCPSVPDDRVLSLVWSFMTNRLVVVRELRAFESYPAFGNHLSAIAFPVISRAISMCFDDESKRLYFRDMWLQRSQ